MTTTQTNKLQLLWDHFIDAEPHSYEKSSWLNVFLAELLAEVKDGKDAKDAISFCAAGISGVSTLIACELLSDVHAICASRGDGSELVGLRKYLVQDRGWRFLAILNLLGIRGLSCGRELVALLPALYPVAFQEGAEPVPANPYVRFHCNDEIVDTIDIILHARKKNTKSKSSSENANTRRKRVRKHSSSSGKQNGKQNGKQKQQPQKQPSVTKGTQETISSESENLSDGIDQARSLTLKMRLNPMDFEYFTSVVRSDEERKWEGTCLYDLSPVRTSRKETCEDYIDERIKAVFNSNIGPFESCLLILQLLQGLRDYDTPTEQTPAVQILKFALDVLWSLQFGIDVVNLTGTECATLKAAAARLMLTALERVLKTDEPTTAVIHNGLLPMTLRLLEDACGKSMSVSTPEEGSYMQEFIFATTYGIITFLYCLLHQRESTEKLKDFLELFQLFVESQDRKLVEITVVTIVALPNCDQAKSVMRARKVIDMIGALISALKRVRQELNSVDEVRRTKQKKRVNTHHHFVEAFGIPFCHQPVVSTITEQVCCISSLFMTLTALLAEAHSFESDLQVRLLKVMAAAGTCCCFPPRILVCNIVGFLKKRNNQTYGPAVALLERILFKELGAYPVSMEDCVMCSKLKAHRWEFLELYNDLLSLDDSKLCYIVIVHLIKVTPNASFPAREALLFRVFHSTFLRARVRYEKNNCNTTAKFLIQACLSMMANLIINVPMFERFMEIGGLQDALKLLPNPIFIRNVFALLEIAVIMEIWKIRCEDSQSFQDMKSEKPALFALTEALERQSSSLLEILETEPREEIQEDSQKPQKDFERLNDQNFEEIEDTILSLNLATTGEPIDLTNYADILENPLLAEKTKLLEKETGTRKMKFYEPSAVWRASAGVALCSPSFRVELSKEPIAGILTKLVRLMPMCIATDKIKETGKSVQRLMEALITCGLTSPLCDCDVVSVLRTALMDPKIKLGQGLAILIESLLRVSVLRPSQEQTIPQQTRPRLPTLNLDTVPDFAGGDSSTGDYMTADDGYEADVEIPGNTHENQPKKSTQSGPVIEPRKHSNAHPALCSLAVDLLIHFSKQGLDGERGVIVTGGLRKVATTCRESASSCAALAGSGAIMRLLDGFKDILVSRDPQHEDLRHAVLEVFTLLATQSISSTELVSYLSLFKLPDPCLSSLLDPLFRLVLLTKPQPNFILSFPVLTETIVSTKTRNEESKNMEKAENLVNIFRKRHLSSRICSPWSVHAICLPVGPELAWPVWLHGGAASMWLRVERGLPTGHRGYISHSSSTPDSENNSLSDWGILTDNWSREVVEDSSYPPAPKSIVHLMSVGFESLVFELWIDLRSDKLILRLTRPDDKTNRTISETSISGLLPSGRWHHLALNFKDTVLNKHSAVVEVVLWVDGWKEVSAQLPFDGLLVRKPGTTCILLGQVGPNGIGAWYLGNLMMFRCPVFNRERALYLASLGPNHTNLAECILHNDKPNFAPLIASGALNGIRELKFEGGKFDMSRRKSYGGTYLRHAVETKVSDTKIDWDAVMDATSAQLGELQDNLLLSYEAQNPNMLHLYPQAVANPGAVVRNLFPGQPAFRVITAPEHRVSQQPPLSIAPIVSAHLECKQYRGLVPAARQVGGIPIFLYLFARVVEMNSTEVEQALALSIVLNLARSDSVLLNQYRTEGAPSLLLRVLESQKCHAGRHILKAILDAACDSSVLIKDVGNGIHSISQDCEAVIIDPELIKCALEAWRTWSKFDTLNLLMQSLILLLRDQHSQREFNASQLNRIGFVDTILTLCKEYFMYEDHEALLDPTTGNAIVELVRALMGAPPEFAHLVAITDYLILVHQASNTYVTHSRHNIYFLLPPLEEATSTIKISATMSVSSSDESIGTIESSKLNKAFTNNQIKKGRMKRKERQNGSPQDTSTGEDSGIAASDGSNHQNEKQSVWSDERRACQGLVCEGLLLLLRDALRVLPDCQVGSVLQHVLRVELLLVLANNPDARVRTAVIKVIQTYLERANDEEINKFIKRKYFMHLANQIALYPGSEPLISSLASLASRGPTLAAMPPLLAMISKAAATDANLARPMVSYLTDIVSKNPNSLRMILEQGLMESFALALINAAHKGSSATLFRDIHVLLVAVATKLLESPGYHHMQAIADLHLVLCHVELRERAQCGADKPCVLAARDAQIALFDGELDVLTSKVSSHSGFRLRSTASYLASASYLTSVLTTSSEQSDQGSRSSSYGSLHGTLSTISREPGKGELNERFRTVLNKAVEFITTADEQPSGNELQLTRRLFSILLHGLSGPLEKKNYWGSVWSSRPVLRKNTAKIMVWLLAPHQSMSTRVYAVRSLMEEPKVREILTSLLDVHPQVEQKFTIFLWDLLCRRDEMPSADARVCAELREALNVWDLAKGLEEGGGIWSEELDLLRRELAKDRNIWIENHYPAIKRNGGRFETIARQLMESAMAITRTVVEEQNRERKVLMEKLKYSKAMKAQTMARWKDLTKRLTHERAPWHFPNSYPSSWELDPTEGPGRVRIRLQRCHLNIEKRFFMSHHQNKLDAAKIEGPLSYLFTSDRQDANATALIERLHTSERIQKMSQATVVTPRAELVGEALIGEACLYFIPDKPDMPLQTDIVLGGLDLAMAGGTAWRLEDIREIHRRRYQLQERAIEIFLVTGRTYLIAFNSSKERDEFVVELSACNLPSRVPGDDLGDALALWRNGTLTNWDYITCLNKLAGRSYNDLMQYLVFPFVLSDYTSDKIDLTNPKIYRNFKRPMAVQDKKNEQHYINNYNYLKQALNGGVNQEPFHYGSHYSNSGTVLHFLVRLPPFTSMFLSYQDNNFDIPDRTFHALATTWRLTSCDSTTDVKELIPEFFYLPEFLLNAEGFDFGVRQNGNRVGDVKLPPWSGDDARLFILAHRAALESDIVREVLPYWIDLVFGFRQTGKPAVEAINVFHPATYYGFNVEQIADRLERDAWETMVRTYGQTPAQLFRAAHPLANQSFAVLLQPSNLPPVIEGVEGIKWGNYVGAPGNEPVLCWKHKHRAPLASLVPLSTGDVFGLPSSTTLLLGYSKEKGIPSFFGSPRLFSSPFGYQAMNGFLGASMLSNMSLLGAALASWSGKDGIARLKSKKEQPPRPLIRSSGLDPITVMNSTPDSGQLWAGHSSGRVTVYTYNINSTGKIEFSVTAETVLLAHRSSVSVISLSRGFSVSVSGDTEGVIVIWDLNCLTYIRSIICEVGYPITMISISDTLGDFAAVFDLSKDSEENSSNQSEMRVYTINARPVGSVKSRRKITALSYSNAPEGVSVNVIATGLDNGVIRLWSSWDLRLVREMINDTTNCGAIITIAWSFDQHHLYSATENSTVLIWEGTRRLNNGTPKFVNLSSL